MGENAEKLLDSNVPVSAWQAIYEENLHKTLESGESVALKDVVEIVFQNAILDRYAPIDEAIKKARIEQKRRVWEGDRSDPELYERLFYACEASKEATKYSMDVSWVNSYIEAVRMIMINQSLNKAVFGGDKEGKEPETVVFLNALQQRILEEYEKLGGKNNLVPVEIGSSAEFHSIPIKISGYNPDGTLRIDADTEEGHASLYKYTKGKGLSPSQFFSEDFVWKK